MNPTQVWWVCMCFFPLAFWYLILGLIFVFFSSACRMARGQEESSTSQQGRKQGPTQGMPSTSNIISSLSMEELRAYCQIPNDIDVVLSKGPTENIVGEEYNAMFLNREQLEVGLCFPCRLWSSNFCTLPERHLPLFTQTSFRF